jgi:hypothetical protein
MIPLWKNPEDDEAAFDEGWGLFSLDPDETIFEIQRDDEKDVFEDDDEALEHVTRLALLGNSLHIRALAVVAGMNPHWERD